MSDYTNVHCPRLDRSLEIVGELVYLVENGILNRLSFDLEESVSKNPWGLSDAENPGNVERPVASMPPQQSTGRNMEELYGNVNPHEDKQSPSNNDHDCCEVPRENPQVAEDPEMLEKFRLYKNGKDYILETTKLPPRSTKDSGLKDIPKEVKNIRLFKHIDLEAKSCPNFKSFVEKFGMTDYVTSLLNDPSLSLTRKLGTAKKVYSFRNYAPFMMKSICEKVERMAFLSFLYLISGLWLIIYGVNHARKCSTRPELAVFIFLHGLSAFFSSIVAISLKFLEPSSYGSRERHSLVLYRTLRVFMILFSIAGMIEIYYYFQCTEERSQDCISTVLWVIFYLFAANIGDAVLIFIAITIAIGIYYL